MAVWRRRNRSGADQFWPRPHLAISSDARQVLRMLAIHPRATALGDTPPAGVRTGRTLNTEARTILIKQYFWYSDGSSKKVSRQDHNISFWRSEDQAPGRRPTSLLKTAEGWNDASSEQQDRWSPMPLPHIASEPVRGDQNPIGRGGGDLRKRLDVFFKQDASANRDPAPDNAVTGGDGKTPSPFVSCSAMHTQREGRHKNNESGWW